MPPKTKISTSKTFPYKKRKRDEGHGEEQEAKSPAEFFAENQAIAGFDNLGKSLYTTIRELVENSLDACESVNILPDIVVKIEEMTMDEFNKVRGVMGIEKKSITTDGTGVNDCNVIKDVGLLQKATPKKRTEKRKTKIKDDESTTQGKILAKDAAAKSASRASGKRGAEAYFGISVNDN